MDDLDMHFMGAFPQVTRIFREHGGRRASRDDSAINYGHSAVMTGRKMSRDDIGINYGYAPTRTHAWNDVRTPPSVLSGFVRLRLTPRSPTRLSIQVR